MKDLGNLLKREIVAFFFLTTQFLSFNIHSRIILACWLAGLSCKPTSFKSRKKVLFRTLTLEVRKYVFIVGQILNVQINERIVM